MRPVCVSGAMNRLISTVPELESADPFPLSEASGSSPGPLANEAPELKEKLPLMSFPSGCMAPSALSAWIPSKEISSLFWIRFGLLRSASKRALPRPPAY